MHATGVLEWEDSRTYDRGKVLSAKALDEIDVFGRYLDVDGDGIGYRTLPGTHPDKGSFFTRGTSRDEFAAYTESPEAYQKNMERLLSKWETAKAILPGPEIITKDQSVGVIYYGTTAYPLPEARDTLRQEGISFDTCRIRSFPFNTEVVSFVNSHDVVFIVEQNRDAQMRTLLINEENFDPAKLVPVLYYAGLSMSANVIQDQISEYYEANKLPRLSEVSN